MNSHYNYAKEIHNKIFEYYANLKQQVYIVNITFNSMLVCIKESQNV